MRIAALLFAFSLWPVAAYALGLGKLELDSGLNEPFEARIDLISATRTELDSLTVKLADIEEFQRAGVDRQFVLSSLRFEVRESEEGPDFIRVFSREAIREPFLNFLVEANWSTGRLYREYTALLDPPLYDSGVGAAISSPPSTPSVHREEAREAEEIEGAAAATGEPGPVVSGAYGGGDYGPTIATDTLWSIASLTRPDSAISVQQMMLALLRANPEAFIENNVNGLRRGHILRMPSREEITALRQEEAMAQVRTQYAAWDQARGILAAATPERPVSGAGTQTEAAPSPTTAEPAAEDKSELRLVAPRDEGAGSDQSVSAVVQSEDGRLSENLALANEQLEALSQENVELKDRLSEAQMIVEDLKRLIALKDDELAALQKQLAGAAPSGQAEAAAGKAETVAAEPVVAGEKAAEEQAALAPITEEGAGVSEKAVAAEEEPAAVVKPAEAVVPAEQKPAPPVPAPAETPVGGIVEQVLGFITGNLLIVGGAAGGLVLVVLILAYIARRRNAEAVAAEEGPEGGFPDFAVPEDETDLPVGTEDATDIRVDTGGAGPGAVATIIPPPPQAPPRQPAAKPASAPPQVPAQPAPVAAVPVEDPLAEVNVFLAYEHFDQAEDFVRDAISREPDNLEFHAKLLEVFFAAGDKRKYEAAAKVLHDKVGAEGPYWEAALAYWQEMSPNRAMFSAAPVDEEPAAPAAVAGRGMLDLTADEGVGSDTAAGLDFDLGDTAQPAPPKADEEEVLDLTAGSGELSSMAATATADESILDVTAAVGLETYENSQLDAGDVDENVLDLTGGSERQEEEDILDVSAGGGEDPLDVTAHTDLDQTEFQEDVLDVTAAARAPGEAEESIDVSGEAPSKAADDSLDIDLSLHGSEAPGGEESDEASSAGENVIEFESLGLDEGKEEPSPELQLSSEESADAGLELDLSSDMLGEAAESAEGETPATELFLDVGEEDDGALELDLEDAGVEAADKDLAGGLGLELDEGHAGKEPEFELDLGMEEEVPAAKSAKDAGPDIDMEGTVEIPKLELADDDNGDDDEDHTVFVPRSSETPEQSADDEIVTKLDLAKAYVELGDKDSAKSILDEVMAAGNDQQRRQAQELMKRLS